MELAGFITVSDVLRSGVYALAHKGEIVYIGKAKCMLSRVAAHRSLWSSERKGQATPAWMPIKGIIFDEIFIYPARLDVIDQLEQEMIKLYIPRHNVHHKPKGKVPIPACVIDQLKNRPEGSLRRV